MSSTRKAPYPFRAQVHRLANVSDSWVSLGWGTWATSWQGGGVHKSLERSLKARLLGILPDRHTADLQARPR
jgi:hypothetical protein